MKKEQITWGCVYLAKAGNMVKVGVSNDPVSRVATLQTGLPEKLELAFWAMMPTRAAAERLEKGVHRQLAHRHVRGEWFLVDIEEAVAVTSRTINQMRSKRARRLPPIDVGLETVLRRIDDGSLEAWIGEMATQVWRPLLSAHSGS